MWTAIIEAVLPNLLAPLKDIFHDYIQGKISEAELNAKVKQALLNGFAQLDAAMLDSITKTYASFMQTAAQSPVMQRGWAIVLYSQLFVLVWHQFVIPFMVTFGFVEKYATSGATVNWAYALIAMCLGAPAILSRVGPAAGWAADNLSRIIKR